MLATLTLLTAAGIGGGFTPTQAPAPFHVERRPIGRLEAHLQFSAAKQDATVDTWLLNFCQPPETSSQDPVSVRLNISGLGSIPLQKRQEPFGFRRPYYSLTFNGGGGNWIQGELTYSTTLYEQWVVRGADPNASNGRSMHFVDSLTAATENQSTVDPELITWIDENDLRRRSNETEEAFAYRFLMWWSQNMRYGANTGNTSPAYVLRRKIADCGIQSRAFAAVLRANNIVATTAYGRVISTSNRDLDGALHAVVIFRPDGGWYPPLDVTAATTQVEQALKSKEEASKLFGHFNGRFLIVHYDENVQIDVNTPPWRSVTYDCIGNVQIDSSGNVAGNWNKPEKWTSTLR